MSVTLHKGDLPGDIAWGGIVAIDTETMGLNPHRDRLCLVQLSAGDGTCHAVQIPPPGSGPGPGPGTGAGQHRAPNLARLLGDPSITKLFHFARFDLAALQLHLGIACAPVYCTKIASKLVRTFTDRHGLKDLCRELIGVELNKQQQSSDWGAPELTEKQLSYAANDVAHLHQLKTVLDAMLAREGRTGLAQACFDFLPARAALDLAGWEGTDIFAH